MWRPVLSSSYVLQQYDGKVPRTLAEVSVDALSTQLGLLTGVCKGVQLLHDHGRCHGGVDIGEFV